MQMEFKRTDLGSEEQLSPEFLVFTEDIHL